jgi:hypothetical protein
VRTSTLIKERENKRQTRASNPVAPKKQAIVCSNLKCNKIFKEPVELTVRMGRDGSLESYYACPHCLSRISIPDNLEKNLSETPLSALKQASNETSSDVGKEKPAGCAHFLGYLKTRSKGSPIPDECLTCNALMKCI